MLKIIVAIVFMFFLDQITKWWIIQNISFQEVYPLIPQVQLTLAQNKGIAFSLLSGGSPFLKIGLIASIVIICSVLIYMLIKTPKEDKWSQVALTLMLGGAFGNLADRIIYGHVIDFVDFYIGSWHWYTFNIADVFITFGALMMVKTILFAPKLIKGAK